MALGVRATWLALIVALVVAALALLPSAVADDGPRLSARHHTIEFAGETNDSDSDFRWRWAVTICSSRAARIKLRHDMAENDAPPGTGTSGSWYVRKERGGCKRYRYTYTGYNNQSVRSRVRVRWAGLRDTTPWAEATAPYDPAALRTD
jgi:hypothetical protein